MVARKRAGKQRRARNPRVTRSQFSGTVPRSPVRIEALLERYSRVKRMLIAYLREHRGDDIRERVARLQGLGRDAEARLIQATEDVLHGWRKDDIDQPHIIDMFLADQRGLNAADRRMVRQWKEVRRCLFRIDRRKERRAKMRNLIDDFDYQVLISGGSEDDLESFAPGVFLSTTIVPLMNAWTLSGGQTIFGKIDARIAHGLAARLAQQLPAEFFRNPKHVERSRELGRRHHERFVETFGQSWVVGTAREIEDANRRFIAEGNQEVIAEGKATAADLEGVRLALDLPAELQAAESVGMFSHPEQGLFFLAELGGFLETFAEPALAREAENRRRVLKYLDDDSIPPGVFELVAGADPDKASKTMRRVLGDPHIDWRRDGDLILREHKPSHFERPPLPSHLAFSSEMAAGLRFLNERENSRQDAGD